MELIYSFCSFPSFDECNISLLGIIILYFFAKESINCIAYNSFIFFVIFLKNSLEIDDSIVFT